MLKRIFVAFMLTLALAACEPGGGTTASPSRPASSAPATPSPRPIPSDYKAIAKQMTVREMPQKTAGYIDAGALLLKPERSGGKWQWYTRMDAPVFKTPTGTNQVLYLRQNGETGRFDAVKACHEITTRGLKPKQTYNDFTADPKLCPPTDRCTLVSLPVEGTAHCSDTVT